MKRFISAILAIIMLCGSLTACSSDTIGKNDGVTTEVIDESTTPETSSVIETTSEPETEEQEVIPEIPEHQTLTILCNNRTEWLVKSLSSCFSERNPDVDFNIIKVDNNRVNDYTAKLNEMLEKGEGPDIFLICEEVVYNTNPYIYSDVLADIDELNEIYSYLDFDDYNETIMNYGIHNGVRKVFPIFYSIPLLIGTEEVLQKENIKYGNGVTLPEFVDSLYRSELGDFSDSIWFDTFYKYSGLNLILDATKYYDIDNEKFKTLVESYESIYPQVGNFPGSQRVSSDNYDNKLCGALLAEHVTFQNFFRFDQYYCSPISYQDIVTAIVDSGKTPVITHIPSFDGDKVTAVVDVSLAINSKTQSPEAALRFLQYAGSLEYMIDDIRYYDCKSISVNKQYIEAEKAAYYGYDTYLPSDYNVAYFYKRFSPLPVEIIDAYYAMLDNIYVPEYASMQAVTHLVDSVIYYEKQNCDFEKFVSEAERRLGNYFAD